MSTLLGMEMISTCVVVMRARGVVEAAERVGCHFTAAYDLDPLATLGS